MFHYTTTIRIHDTDAAGVVYFGHFFRLMHEAYEAWFTQQGVRLGDILSTGEVFIPITHAEADYKVPLVCGDIIRIALQRDRVTAHAYGLSYQIFNPQDVLAASGKTVHVAIDRRSREKIPLPAPVRAALEAL